MKVKLLAALAGLCFSYGLGAQVPNPGFESWQNVAGWYDNPVGWKTTNFQLSTPVVRDSMPHQGSFAMKVKTNGVAWTKFYSGVSPQSIKMYVRAAVAPADTAVIFYFASKNGAGVGSNIVYITGSISTWSLVTLTVTTSAQADSIEVYVTGGEEQSTYVSVDDLSAPGILTGIDGPGKKDCGVMIRPNPMSRESVIEFCAGEGGDERNEVLVYNALGAEVAHYTGTGAKHLLERASLSAGLYLVVTRRGSKQYSPVRLLVTD
jgi:hypothetical protein